MPTTINTNMASLSAQRALQSTDGSLSTSMKRLSTGLRINSAKDDSAGLAIADQELSNAAGSDSKTALGYTVGAGAEYAITKNITVRGEYRFTEYAKIKNHITAIPTFVGFSGTQAPNFHTVRAGVSYKF